MQEDDEEVEPQARDDLEDGWVNGDRVWDSSSEGKGDGVRLRGLVGVARRRVVCYAACWAQHGQDHGRGRASIQSIHYGT